MMNGFALFNILIFFVHVTHSKPWHGHQYDDERNKRQQIAVPGTHLVNGRIETKEGIIMVNKHAGKDKKFNVLHVPVLENNKGVPFEITAKESGKSYLTGPALRILSKNNKYDEHNPFIFFPLLKAHHSQG